LRLLCSILLLLAPLAAQAQQSASNWEAYLNAAASAAAEMKYVLAEQLAAQAMKESEHYAQNDPRYASTLNTTGLIWMADNKPKEAEPLFRRALASFEKAYGADSMDAANTCYNLSDSLRRQGNYSTAEPILQRTLQTYLSFLGLESPKVAQVYYLIGDTQRHLHNYLNAELNLKRAADMREAQEGMESVALADALHSLALCYAAQYKYGAAEPLFKLSLNIREARYGLNDKSVAESLESYAAMLREAGRVKDSEKLTALAEVITKTLRTGK